MTNCDFAFLMLGWMAGLGLAGTYGFAARYSEPETIWIRTLDLPDTDRTRAIEDEMQTVTHTLHRKAYEHRGSRLAIRCQLLTGRVRTPGAVAAER